MVILLCTSVISSGLIYDYCWSPLTNHFLPDTCTILATAKYNPVHMIGRSQVRNQNSLFGIEFWLWGSIGLTVFFSIFDPFPRTARANLDVLFILKLT